MPCAEVTVAMVVGVPPARVAVTTIFPVGCVVKAPSTLKLITRLKAVPAEAVAGATMPMLVVCSVTVPTVMLCPADLLPWFCSSPL